MEKNSFVFLIITVLLFNCLNLVSCDGLFGNNSTNKKTDDVFNGKMDISVVNYHSTQNAIEIGSEVTFRLSFVDWWPIPKSLDLWYIEQGTDNPVQYKTDIAVKKDINDNNIITLTLDNIKAFKIYDFYTQYENTKSNSVSVQTYSYEPSISISLVSAYYEAVTFGIEFDGFEVNPTKVKYTDYEGNIKDALVTNSKIIAQNLVKMPDVLRKFPLLCSDFYVYYENDNAKIHNTVSNHIENFYLKPEIYISTDQTEEDPFAQHITYKGDILTLQTEFYTFDGTPSVVSFYRGDPFYHENSELLLENVPVGENGIVSIEVNTPTFKYGSVRSIYAESDGKFSNVLKVLMDYRIKISTENTESVFAGEDFVFDIDFPGMETAAQTVNFIIKSEKIPGKDNAFDQKEIQCNITDGKVIVPTDKLPAAELDLYIKLDDLTISNTKTISLKPKINLKFCDRNNPCPATEYMQIGIAVDLAEDYHISSNGNVTVCTPYGEIDGKLYAGSNKSGTLRFLLDEQHFPANKTVELYVTDGIYSSNLSYLKVSQ